MKKALSVLVMFVAFLSFSFDTSAANKHDLGNGVSVVQYGNTWVIEDNNRKMSISMEIAQAGKDRKNSEMMYNVICEGNTKRVAKRALQLAIAESVKAAALSSGTTLITAAAGLAADIIYDEACEYWKNKGGY